MTIKSLDVFCLVDVAKKDVWVSVTEQEKKITPVLFFFLLNKESPGS